MPPDILATAIEIVDIGQIDVHPDNPNKGDAESIGESFDDLGMFTALGVQRSSGYVIVGNHRLLAARLKGMPEVPVIWLDVDDDTAMEILLRDNVEGRKGENDERRLLDALQRMQPERLIRAGYSEDERDNLRRMLSEEPALGDLRSPRAPAVDVKCQIGDIKWTVSKEAYAAWEAERLQLCGGRHEEVVQSIRQDIAL